MYGLEMYVSKLQNYKERHDENTGQWPPLMGRETAIRRHIKGFPDAVSLAFSLSLSLYIYIYKQTHTERLGSSYMMFALKPSVKLYIEV